MEAAQARCGSILVVWLIIAALWSPSLACVCGEWRAGFPGEWAVCREAGEGPATDGELGQFLCTGDGMARLALVNGDPTSRPCGPMNPEAGLGM